MNAPLFGSDGDPKGERSLPALFDGPVNEALLHQAVVMYQANRRQGTSNTKTRSEVSGGGRKPWRQKGTGRARQGSIRAPQWRKGGTVFGPHPRSYRQALPVKARRAALRSALAQRASEGQVLVLEGVTPFEKPATRRMAQLFEKIGAEKALLVLADRDANTYLSVRNIGGAATVIPADLNALEVLLHRHVVFTDDALRVLEEALSK